MKGAAEHRVVGGFSILAGLAGFLVPSDKEYGVVGSRGDRQRRQHRDHECGETQQFVVSQQCDQPSGRAHFESDHHQHQQHSLDRAIGDEQHDHDDQAGDAHHLEHALVGGLIHVGCQWRWARDVNLETLRWR